MTAIAERLLPQGNPDFQKIYQDEVVMWWFELDDMNWVRREVAFDASGRAVAAAPLGPNEGIFTDLGAAPDGLGPEVEQAAFEEKWQEVRDRWFETTFASKPR